MKLLCKYTSNLEHLGEWKGEYSNKDYQRSLLEFWRTSGLDGAKWLIERSNVTKYTWEEDAIISALIEIGIVAIGPILDALESPEYTNDSKSVLLRALRYIPTK